MRVFAYCALDFAESMRRVAGITPVTCPPLTADLFDVGQLVGYDLLFFDLHGLPGEAHWYAEARSPGGISERLIALRAEQVRQASLTGSTIFALSCYMGDPENPMRQAFLDAGARWVIGGAGENWAGERGLAGAGLLGYWLRVFMSIGFEAERALTMAKSLMQMTPEDGASDDALAFQAFGQEDMA